MQLPKKDKDYLLSLKREDIDLDLLFDLLGDRAKVVNGKVTTIPSKLNIYAEFTLEPKEYFNKTKVKTTVGQFIYNKVIIEEDLSEIVGYVNTPIDAGQNKKIEAKISHALLNDKITTEQMLKYLDRLQWLAMSLTAVITTAFSKDIVKPNPKIVKKRDELIKANKEKLEQGDVITAVKIENELTKEAEEVNKNDYGMNLYRSGGAGSFHNNYKAMQIMKGPIQNPTTGKWDVVTSNLMEGIKKKDIPPMANSITTGAYPKAVGTQTSGYLSKQIVAAFQTVTLDKPGSDCHTKGFLPVTLTDYNKNLYIYRYIIEGSKLVLLDDATMPKYVGKTVKMRSPMFCTSKKICRICAGQMFDKLGIDHIGMSATRISGTLLNGNMKKFHDATASIYVLDKNELEL